MSIKPLGGGRWFIDARVVKNGRQFRERETFEGSRTAAEARHWEIKRELAITAENESICSLELQTFGDALDYYYKAKGEAHLVSPSAFARMKADLGSIQLSNIGAKFKSYWLLLRRTKSRQTGEDLAPSTVNHYTVMAKAALNMCVKDGLLDVNPLAHIPILKVTPRDVTLSEIDRQRLLNVVDREAPHLSAILRFALDVPSRKSELVNLRREDLDLVNNAVRVRHQNAKGDNGSWKPIPPGWLTDYFRNLPSDTDHLFFRRDQRGRCLPLGNFRRAFVRCLKIAGVQDFHFHDTRHLAATELLNAGNPEVIVCQIAGWRSGNMIRHYYRKDGLRAVRQVVFPGERCTGVHLSGSGGNHSDQCLQAFDESRAEVS